MLIFSGSLEMVAADHWRYLYTLTQWLPLSATTTCPAGSGVMARPWGPYSGQPPVFTYDRKEPNWSNTWILNTRIR